MADKLPKNISWFRLTEHVEKNKEDLNNIFKSIIKDNVGIGTEPSASIKLSILNTDYSGTNYGIYNYTKNTLEENNFTTSFYNRTEYEGSTTQTLLYGIDNRIYSKGSGNIEYFYGDISRAYVQGTANIVRYAGINSILSMESGSSMTNGSLFYGILDNFDGDITGTFNGVLIDLNVDSGGSIDTLNGIYLRSWSNSGTIDKSRGIYIDSSIDVGNTSHAILSESTSPSEFSGNLKANTLKTEGFTVGSLPTPSEIGMRAYVTDATEPTFRNTVVGGGAEFTPVIYNGTEWICA